MKRKMSLLLSIALIAAYTVKSYAGGDFLASLAFTLPPLATDVVTVLLLIGVWRGEPASQDESWQAFFGSMLGAHLFLIAGLAGFTLVNPGAYRPVQIACGLALTASYPLAIYTLLVLGRSFSVLPEAKRLVTVGPYRWSRHPLYVIHMFWFLLYVGIAQTPLVAALASANAALQIYRARREEIVLASTFGDEYEAYRAETMWVGRRRVTPGALPDDE